MRYFKNYLLAAAAVAVLFSAAAFAQTNLGALPLAELEQLQARLEAENAQLEQELMLREKIKKEIANNSTTVVYIATQEVIDKAEDDGKSMLSRLAKQDGINVVVFADTEKKNDKGKTIFNYDSAYCNGVQCFDGKVGVLPPTEQFKGPITKVPNGAVVLVFEKENNGKSTEYQVNSKDFDAWLQKKRREAASTPVSGTAPNLPQNPLPDPRFDRPPRPQSKPAVIKVPLYTALPIYPSKKSYCKYCDQLKNRLDNEIPGWEKYVDIKDPKDSPSGFIPCITNPTGKPITSPNECFDYLQKFIAEAKKQEALNNASGPQALPPIIFRPAPPRTTSVASPGGPSDAEVEAEKQRITEEINKINALIKALEMSNNPNDQVILDGLRQELKNILQQ